jgi:phospholipid transport system transporter-binding protein
MREGDSADLELIDGGTGRIQVRGSLTFGTARRARSEGSRLLSTDRAAVIEVDCAEVTTSDSAGLAVLLDWIVLAQRHGCTLHFLHLPGPIQAVAEISDVESYINQGLTK